MCREEKSAYGPLVAAIKLILGFQTLLAIKLALCCVLSLTSCCQNCTDTGLAILLKNNPNIHWFRGLSSKSSTKFWYIMSIDTKMNRKTVKRYSCTYVTIIIACNAIDEISNTYEYKMTKYVE